MEKEYYRLDTSYCSYYACVWHQYPDQDKVFIGSRKKCVSFSVYDYDPDPNLDGLGYSEHCNTTGNLQRGPDTQHMLKTALQFMMHKYPNNSKKFLFRDTSYIQGSRETKISLAHYHILHYHKTWYEKHFLAEPHGEEQAKKYYDEVKAFKKMFKSKPALDIKHPKVKKLYEDSKDLTEFVANMKTADAHLYKDWCSSLVQSHISNVNEMAWCIQASKMQGIPDVTITALEDKPVDLFSMMQGGDEPSDLNIVITGPNDSML